MNGYKAPITDALFILDSLINVDEAYGRLPALADCNMELCETILSEAAKLAENVFAPLNTSGDREGCQYNAEDKSVTIPKGFKEAYQAYSEGGWGGLSSSTEDGGQGLPKMLSVILDEFFASSNVSLSMYAGLTHGAIVSLKKYASPELKAAYLEQLISGRFSGTMCLTEPQAGSDLGLLKTKATPKPGEENKFLLNGSKIWITGGEHDLSENIIHLVLARLPDAPAGSRGISLFLVPKFLPENKRNTIFCTGLEHKMGINGSATCFMSLEDAEGWLIGEPHSGLKYMFAMMNSARILVGMQGLGLAENAYQVSLNFAKERRQGRSMLGAVDPNESADCILVHPDVRRMIATQKVLIEGGRALAYQVGLYQDIATHAESEEERESADGMVALLTPVVKAFLTDQGFISCDLAVQSMGGSGFTQDWAAEQCMRDARITRIYEGTNAIQALDLVGRKLSLNGGAPIKRFLEEIKTFVSNNSDDAYTEKLASAVQVFEKAIAWISSKGKNEKNQVASAATPFLKLFGFVTLAYLWNRMAVSATSLLAQGDTRTDLLNAKIKSRNFYFAQCLPEIHTLLAVIESGDEAIMAFDISEF